MPEPSTATDSTTTAFPIITLEDLKREGVDILIDFGTRIAIAVLIIFIGFWIARRIVRLTSKVMVRRDIDITLRPFIEGFVGFAVRAMVLIVAISTIGVQMTSIIAVLGSVGLAIGLALQGSLANFAGGVIILIMKPFKVGERIETSGAAGFVKEINIFNTTLVTLDNRTIYVPNGPLAGNIITNYHRAETRRVDISVGISYSSRVDVARKAILDLANANEKVLQDPAAFVGLDKFGDSSLDLVVRVWSSADDYWDVYYYMTEGIKRVFDENNISIPFPQRDIHIISNTNSPS